VRETTLAGAFRFAGEGLCAAFRTQRNFRIHVAVGTLAMELGIVMGLRRWEWAVLILAVGEVLTLELINTAVEAVVDLASPGLHRLAKIAKDVVAAAVLVEALTAVGVGVVIFGPRLRAMPSALTLYVHARPFAFGVMVVVWCAVVGIGLATGRATSVSNEAEAGPDEPRRRM
jgi:diacylglycerol kinase (ATP)